MLSEKTKDSIIENTIGLLALLVSLMVISGPLLFAYESYIWLRFGLRPAFNMYDAFAFAAIPVPTTDWVGVQKVLAWFYAQEIVWTISLIGFVIGGFGIAYVERFKERRRERLMRAAANTPSTGG